MGTLSECVCGHLEPTYKVKEGFSKKGFMAGDSAAHGDSRNGVSFPPASHNRKVIHFSRSMSSSTKTLDCKISLDCILRFVFIHICYISIYLHIRLDCRISMYFISGFVFFRVCHLS